MKTTQVTWLELPKASSPCTLIAEVAQSHDGSLGMAHAFIDAAARAGADAIKFQTHIAEEESTAAEPWRTAFSYQDATRMDYWKRMEFTREQWLGLKQHADQANLLFMSSPFSIQAVEWLEGIGMPGWKVASGEINNYLLLDRILQTGQPVILSTGLSAMDEIAASVERIQASRSPLALLQCTSRYPCPPDLVGLNVISEFTNRFQCAVGLSDHSGSIVPAIAAATQGAQVIEVHLTLSREMFGPDVVASVTTQEFKQMVESVRLVESMLQNPVDKQVVPNDLAELRRIFMKSLYTCRDIHAQEEITRDKITAKKPGTGIPVSVLEGLLGGSFTRDIPKNTMLSSDDIKPPKQ